MFSHDVTAVKIVHCFPLMKLLFYFRWVAIHLLHLFQAVQTPGISEWPHESSPGDDDMPDLSAGVRHSQGLETASDASARDDARNGAASGTDHQTQAIGGGGLCEGQPVRRRRG